MVERQRHHRNQRPGSSVLDGVAALRSQGRERRAVCAVRMAPARHSSRGHRWTVRPHGGSGGAIPARRGRWRGNFRRTWPYPVAAWAHPLGYAIGTGNPIHNFRNPRLLFIPLVFMETSRMWDGGRANSVWALLRSPVKKNLSVKKPPIPTAPCGEGTLPNHHPDRIRPFR